MAQFDLDAYLSTKVDPANTTRKIEELQAASLQKVAKLQADHENALANRQAKVAADKAAESSWVGRIGLNPESGLGEAVNLGASLVSGASRVAGQLASLPYNLSATADENAVSQAQINAANRKAKGEYLPGDEELLNRPNIIGTGNLTEAEYAARPVPTDGRPVMPSAAEQLAQAKGDRATARDLNNLFDLSGIVHQGNRQELSKDIARNFDENWANVTGARKPNAPGNEIPGFTAEGNTPIEGMQFRPGQLGVVNTKDGTYLVPENATDISVNYGKFKDSKTALNYIQKLNLEAQDNDSFTTVLKGFGSKDATYGERIAQVASGIGGLIAEAGRAAFNNPTAAAEYIVENIPQLAIGAAGKAGGTLLSTSNAGYAYDYYSKGIEKYQKENKGQLPPAEEREKMAMYAASLALAEQVGDLSVLRGARGAAEAASGAVATGAKAAAKGAVSEGLTEGWQTFAEGEASRAPASAKDIYEGAVIGGIAGAGLSGGASFAHAAAAPKRIVNPDTTPEAAKQFADAAATGDTAVFTDPKTKDYDLSKAVGVLLQHSMSPDVTPEVKASNLKQAGDLMAQLEEQHTSVKEAVENRSPEKIAQYEQLLERKTAELAATPATEPARTAQLEDQVAFLTETLEDAQDSKQALRDNTRLSKLERQLETGRARLEALTELNSAPSTKEDVATFADQLSTGDAETKTNAATQLINLSMAQPDALTSKQALDLANDTSNGLNTVQRDHLRAFNAARIAENNLSNQSKTSQEVFYGSKKNVGIAQYRARISSALTAGNLPVANKQMTMLENFAADHESKVAAAEKALESSDGNQIVKTTDGRGWVVVPKAQKMSMAEMQKNGGLTVVSEKLVDEIRKEAQALRAVSNEMASAIKLQSPVADSQLAPVQSVSPNAPANNNNTPVNEEELARPDVPSVPVKTGEPTQSQEIVNISPASPTSEPASPVAAKAAPATAPSLAPAVKSEAVQQPDGRSAASTAPVADTATTETVEKKSTISVLNQPKNAAAPYTEQNLVSEYFQQKAGNAVTGTQRPLAVVPDFLTAIKNKTVKLGDFLALKAPATPEQRAVVSAFMASAAKWAGNIKANLKKSNKGFEFENLMSFFINEAGDIDQNVKAAIAYSVFSWTAENAARPELNSKEEINAILGRDDSALVSQQAMKALETVGTRQNVVVNALGQRIVQALGLTVGPNAPRNLQPDLEASVGAHALKLMLDQGILARTTISGQEMAEMTSSKDTDTKAVFYFVKLARDSGKLTPQAEFIFEKSMGTQGILDKLFGVESALKEPSTTPIKNTQKTTRNTDQAIPSELKKMVSKDDAEASTVRPDMFNLASQVAPETMLEIAGFTEIDAATIHKTRRASLEAKNAGLVRELENFMGYVGRVGTDMPMYFEHSVWKQQRVGIATNMINPQTSKIHRNMLTRGDWDTTIQVNDVNAMQNFKLRVAEGMGVKTDKKSMEKALNDFNTLVQDPAVKGAVNVLVKSLNGDYGGQMPAKDQAILLAGVKVGGEDMHSLSALMDLAHYTNAVRTGQAQFDSKMMAEVDGVTNGPMLSHLLLGAADTVAQMYNLLNRGGFFQEGSAHVDYNSWRDAPGNFDLYETTALHMTQAIQAAAWPESTMAPIYAFTGELADKDTGNVTKAGRNIIKTPLTAMVFGSSVASAVDSMADGFVESIYGAIEDSTKGDGMLESTILEHLDALGVRIAAGTDLMEYSFNKNEVRQLKAVFKETLGKSVETTMKADFEVFIDQRTQFNLTAQMTYAIYEAAYNGMREQMVKDLIAEGKIAVNPKTGVPLHDLTNKQEKELRAKLEALTPVANTPMSKQSKELDSGLLIAKADRKLSTNPMYQSVVKFGQPFVDNKASSTQVNAYEVANTGPGVAMVPMLMHSADSAISVRANPEGKALNVHDAQGFGVGGIVETAKAMNKATWDTMLGYSPAAEITAALVRTIHGFNALAKSGSLPDSVLDSLASTLIELGAAKEVSPEGVLATTAALAQTMAYRADSMKLETLAKMQSVNQYAMENGAYAVTASDRASAASLRSALEAGLSAADRLAVDSVSDLLAPAIKKAQGKGVAAVANPEMDTKAAPVGAVAELGKPAVKSDAVLVDAFAKQPVMGLQDVVNLLRPQLKGEFQQRLLTVLERSTGQDLKVVYVTPTTAPEALLDVGGEKSRGWYVSHEGQQAVYLLSPDFKYSGLTAEVVLHELTHASLARTIANAELLGTGDAYALVQELDALRVKAQQFVTKNKLEAQFAPALVNVHELVSWGMSNTEFQQQVLNKVELASTTGGNKLITAMQSFINKLTGLLFGRENVNMANGLKVLITNTSGLFYAAAKAKVTVAPSVTLDAINNQSLKDLSTLDIHEALVQTNNGVQVTPEFNQHLKDLLGSIVNKLHGPFGSFKAALMEQTAMTPEQVYQEALITGVAPFAQEASVAGFQMSQQEAFAMEQVQVTVLEAFNTKDGTTSAAYRELTQLYAEVMRNVTPASFITTANPTATEQAEAQALYDFMFAVTQDVDGKSDYLSRFAGLGMANEQVNTMLKTLRSKVKAPVGKVGFNERLTNIITGIIDWFGGKLTNTYAGQRTDLKLKALVQQLVKIEARKRHTLEVKKAFFEPVENTLGALSAKAQAQVTKFASLPYFKQNANGFIRAIGSMTNVLAKDRTDALMEGLQRVRDQNFNGQQQGMLASAVNEFRGSHAGNVIFHFLLRASKHIEGIRKDIIAGTGRVVASSFANNGQDLTKDHNKAISAVFLRTGMADLLGQYSMAELSGMVNSKAKVQAEIAKHEAQINALGYSKPINTYFINAVKTLAYYKATGKVASAHMMMNAHNIARLTGTGHTARITEAQAQVAQPLLDSLASLYAIEYSSSKNLHYAQEVLAAEAARTDGGNGVEMTLRTHKSLNEKSAELLFGDSPALQMKGYTPEMYDPFMTVMVADQTEGDLLVKQGYIKGDLVQSDLADPTAVDRHIYSLRDGGLKRRVTGTFSFTGTAAKGSRIHSGNLSPLSYSGQFNASTMAAIGSRKQAGINAMFRNASFDPAKVTDHHMAPVVNANGDVVNYRYLMLESTKDALLDRDNRPDKILGTMAGSVFDKVASPVQNRKVVEALHEQYKAEFAERPESYLTVGPKSTDPQLREIWALLPDSTKKAVREVWGKDAMQVRTDLMDINFGYKKLSIADAFDTQEDQRSFTEKMFVELMSYGFDEKAKLRTRQAEDIWQAVVKATKGNLVVRSWSTMSGNLRSNWSQLVLMGVNPAAILKGHNVAFKGAWAHKKDTAKLFELQHALQTGYLAPGQTKNEIEHEIVRLQDAINRNPVKPLIDAGLMPTIVEDIDTNDDIYSYQSKFNKVIAGFTDKLNPSVVGVGKFMLMTEDSTPYKVMSYATQISDFLARYTLYEYSMNKKNPLTHEQAVQLASDAFINYDVPTHRKLQYANDSGLVMFTKYYMRIQKMLVRIYREHPGRVIGMVGLEQMIGDQPTVLDSSMMNRFGNPLNMGALDYFGSLDSLTTVKLVTSPFTSDNGGFPTE